jgi:predicted Zn-dependent protease
VAYIRNSEGEDEWDCEYFSANLASLLPSKDVMEQRTRQLLQSLSEYVTTAEPREQYYGPVLFEAQAASEIVQHGIGPKLASIPGDNKNPTGTLLSSLNMRVLPEFISVSDDPTLTEFRGKPLSGHSSIDSDGMNAARVQLVDHGFLRAFLCGREPVYKGQHSNGHNLAQYVQSTTLVLEAAPDHAFPMDTLRAKLIEMAKKRGLKEAIIVRRISPSVSLDLGGTALEARNDTVAQSHLTGMYAVNVETGKETRIRGLTLNHFGRPQMDNIVAAGDDAQALTTINWTSNVRSVITPSLLMDNVELEEVQAAPLAPYPLTDPLAKAD